MSAVNDAIACIDSIKYKRDSLENHNKSLKDHMRGASKEIHAILKIEWEISELEIKRAGIFNSVKVELNLDNQRRVGRVYS